MQSSLTMSSREFLSGSFVDRVPDLTAAIRKFAAERDWARFHRPRSLLLALVGEMGELAEIFQFKEDENQTIALEELDKAQQEIADVAIYLLRLADVCGVRIGKSLSRPGRDDDSCAPKEGDRSYT